MKAQDLKLYDVVRYPKATDPFPNMRVVRIEQDGIYLHRPYISSDGVLGCEELYWRKDSNFLFKLVERCSQ